MDDQPLIRAGLASLIRAAPGLDVVAEASDGVEAVALAARTRPDVVLMDIRMPGMSGVTATEHILAAPVRPKPRVLILTTLDLDEYVYTALQAGACGFLLKDTPPERLIAAIATVSAEDVLLAPAVTRRLIETYARRSPGPAATAGLTARENEVLRLVARGLSNGAIAAGLVLSEATVKTHVSRIMAKLGLGSRAQVVVFAYESRLVTPREPR
ncbi:response regulator transcription factor [Longispora sp. NPDC051575]|uniref:response regulator transcription factor n=1 Tax=Longispora sp. NPDC051575 TaxID=3154943 RepID=UPI00341D0E12